MAFSFVMRGMNATIQDMSDVTISPKLAAGTYIMRYDELRDIVSLDRTADMGTASKVYGPVRARVKRIMDRFNVRSGTTGILLSGMPGTGKTLLARELGGECLSAGYPIIQVQEGMPLHALQRITTTLAGAPVMFLFDEIEKTHALDDLNDLLAFLDGTGGGACKMLAVLTANAASKLPDPFFNRPNRIYYHYTHGGVDDEIMKLVIDDRLENQANRAGLEEMLSRTFHINMDSLVSWITEMNIGNMTAAEAIDGLNIEVQMPTSYEVDVQIKDLSNPEAKMVFRQHNSSFADISRIVAPKGQATTSFNLMGHIYDRSAVELMNEKLPKWKELSLSEINEAGLGDVYAAADEDWYDEYIYSNEWEPVPGARGSLRTVTTSGDIELTVTLTPFIYRGSAW